MKKTHNNVVIAEIDRGDVITAAHMSRIARAVNANTRFLGGPKQQNALLENESANTRSGDLVFTETSRVTATKELIDDNGDISEVEQIDRVILTNSSGEVLELNFDNP